MLFKRWSIIHKKPKFKLLICDLSLIESILKLIYAWIRKVTEIGSSHLQISMLRLCLENVLVSGILRDYGDLQFRQYVPMWLTYYEILGVIWLFWEITCIIHLLKLYNKGCSSGSRSCIWDAIWLLVYKWGNACLFEVGIKFCKVLFWKRI